jgi:hypothetical protein
VINLKFVSINDSLAPIRLLRQVGGITDTELAELLAAETEFKRGAAADGDQWIDVYDCRTFAGSSEAQERMVVDWLITNAVTLTATTLGIAFAIPARLEVQARRLASHLEQLEIPSHVGNELDEALYWALERAHDEDIWLAPSLVLGGIDALRQTMK